MKLPESLFSRMVLAGLPFMFYVLDFEKAWRAAVSVAVVFWATVLFFWFTRRLFPERFLKEAFFLWLLVWAQAGWFWLKLEPLWIVSVFFLIPVSFLEKRSKPGQVPVFSKKVWVYFQERAFAGLGFVGLVLGLTWTQAVLESRGLGAFFQQPAGLFLLIAVAAVLWKRQPWGKR